MLPPVADKVEEVAMEHLTDLISRVFNSSQQTFFMLSILRCIKFSITYREFLRGVWSSSDYLVW